MKLKEMTDLLTKFVSRRIALSVAGVSTVVTAAMEDGTVTPDEYWGIVIAVAVSIIVFGSVDAIEKGKVNEESAE